MGEAVGTTRANREFKETLLSSVSPEVVRGPEVAVVRGMALDQSVVRAYPGLLEAGALRHKALDVAGDVHALLIGQAPEKSWAA